MNRKGRDRRERLVELCPPARVVVDVGADHGHVAHALRAVATERDPRRIGRRDVPWVVADGLLPFREVDVAVVAGMGWRTLAGILERGPRPRVAVVVHAQDDPPALRRWLASHGWRIDAERLAREAGRFAEVIRAVPGEEPARGLVLEYGPRLRADGDPLLAEHLAELHAWLADLACETAATAAERSADLARRAAYVTAWAAEIPSTL